MKKMFFLRLGELRHQALKKDITSDEAIKVDNEISNLMSSLNFSVENYPELRSNQNFLSAQESLNYIEANLNSARRAFNAAVTDYNNGVDIFPMSIFAKMMGLRRKELFVIPEIQRQNIDVDKIMSA